MVYYVYFILHLDPNSLGFYVCVRYAMQRDFPCSSGKPIVNHSLSGSGFPSWHEMPSFSLAKPPFLRCLLSVPWSEWGKLTNLGSSSTRYSYYHSLCRDSREHATHRSAQRPSARTPPHDNQAVWEPQGSGTDHRVGAKGTAACSGRGSSLSSAGPASPAACTPGCPSSRPCVAGSLACCPSPPAPIGSTLFSCSARMRSSRTATNWRICRPAMLTGCSPWWTWGWCPCAHLAQLLCLASG